MANDKMKEVVDKLWPKTKKELEKALENTKKMIDKGEAYLKTFSEKSAEQTKKLSLNLKKEKLFYDLGKALSTFPKSKWAAHRKAGELLKEIKNIDREVKKIK